jgi:MEMO1 family protein
MRYVITLLLSIFITMDSYSQNQSTDRLPVAAGRFYEADKATLEKQIERLFLECKKTPETQATRAIISPHAGYIYSGKVAAAAFSAIPKDALYKNIFIIGSSHVMAFDGASVYNIGDFITPLGKAKVNKEIANNLKNNKVFNFPVNAHKQEHSLEVQIPFIQYYFTNDPEIVPIIIGTDNISTLRLIAEALKPWFTTENLFIISSDFSHYPSYRDALEVDNLTAEALVTGNPHDFMEALRKNDLKNVEGLVTSMCGSSSGLLLMYLAEKNSNLQFKRIDYCNSGDSPIGDKSGVVGYHAISLVEKNFTMKSENIGSAGLSFTRKEADLLFEIAKNSIWSKLNENNNYHIDEKKVPEALKQHLGVFVTLKQKGALRGCIGIFTSTDPLFKLVQASALSSAFEDTRFHSVTKEEFNSLSFEITVLGPMKKINNINEIVLGKHGIYIKKDLRAGTMLPQVATENGWTVLQFLGYTSRDKAGIGWDGWKDAELYIYEGLVLEENK